MSFPVSLIPPEPKAHAALQVAARAERLHPGDPVYDRLSAQIREKAGVVIEATGPKSEKEFTARLVAADHARDQAFTALALAAQARSLMSAEPDQQEKAQHLHGRLVPDTLGFLYDSMHAESTVLTERLAYLESPEGAALVADLRLTPFVENLKARMAAYDASYADRAARREERPEQLWAAAAPLDRALRALHAVLLSQEGAETARAVFTDLEPLLGAARAARTRRATPDRE